jgi:hypothetical protein
MASTPSRTLVLTLTAVTDKFSKGIGDAEGKLGGFGEKLGSFAKKSALAIAAVGAAAGALAIKVGKDAIAAASDLSEEVSKSGEIFGESAAKIQDWASTAANAFGQSRRQATAAASNFAIFGKAAGLTGDELVDFSTGFTELASDLASFNNTTPEDAINALGSALRGEALPLRRYGILLDDTTLRQKALELGIIDNVKNALTPQQKVLAAQAAIYDQVGSAAGDFARTSDGLANSQRILAANLEDVKSTLGESLLPIAEQFSGWLVSVLPDVIALAKQVGERLAPALERAGDFIRDKFLPWAKEVWPQVKEFATSVRDLVTSIVEFVRDEIAPRALELIRNLKEPATEAWAAIKDLSSAVNDVFKAFQRANPEGSVFLDLLFKLAGLQWDFLLGKLERLARGLEQIARFIERIVNLGGGDILGLGGGSQSDLRLPEFTPGVALPTGRGQVLGGTSNAPVTINIVGPYDSEGAAREVRRVLADSGRRTGYGVALAF